MRMRLSLVALAILVGGCDHRGDGGRQALREAEIACKLPEGMLQYLGSSDDPQPGYAPSGKSPLWVMTPDLGWGRLTDNHCLAGFTSSPGYRIEQPSTD